MNCVLHMSCSVIIIWTAQAYYYACSKQIIEYPVVSY